MSDIDINQMNFLNYLLECFSTGTSDHDFENILNVINNVKIALGDPKFSAVFELLLFSQHLETLFPGEFSIVENFNFDLFFEFIEKCGNNELYFMLDTINKTKESLFSDDKISIVFNEYDNSVIARIVIDSTIDEVFNLSLDEYEGTILIDKIGNSDDRNSSIGDTVKDNINSLLSTGSIVPFNEEESSSIRPIIEAQNAKRQEAEDLYTTLQEQIPEMLNLGELQCTEQ